VDDAEDDGGRERRFRASLAGETVGAWIGGMVVVSSPVLDAESH